MRKLLKRYLTSMGYAVDLAEDGSHGWSLWRRNRYDLVLTDWSMPGMDGRELTSRIRADERPSSRVPVIALTGNTAGSAVASRHGVSDALGKPFTAASLRRRLERWLPPADEGADTTARTQKETGALRPPSGILEHSSIVRRLGRTFLENLPDYRDALDEALATGSATRGADAAHKLKSAAQLLGASELAALCETLERTANEANRSEVRQLTSDIRDALQKLASTLESDLF